MVGKCKGLTPPKKSHQKILIFDKSMFSNNYIVQRGFDLQGHEFDLQKIALT